LQNPLIKAKSYVICNAHTTTNIPNHEDKTLGFIPLLEEQANE
jgi:hypothetical protein